MREGVMRLARIIDMIDVETKLKLYSFTKGLIEQNKEPSTVEIMNHDSYKKIKGRIRQVGWASNYIT